RDWSVTGVQTCALPICEGRNGNPRGSAANEFGQTFGDVGLGWRAPIAERIRGIPDQRETALVAERTQLGFIGRRADDRCWIDLRSEERRVGKECRSRLS